MVSPVFREDDIKLLNFDTVIEKFHGSMRHSLKQICSSCNDISPGLLKSDPHLPKKKFTCFNNTPSKKMKNAFHFILKALFILKIFKFFSWPFEHVEKRLDYKYKLNLEIYEVTAWLTNNYNTRIAQHLTD